MGICARWMDREAELGSALNYEQMLYAPFAPGRPLGLANGLTAAGSSHQTCKQDSAATVR